MERYFDAFCYLTNWGARRLMFRFPRPVLDAETARQYCHSSSAEVTETNGHVIISLNLNRDPDDEWLEDLQGDGLLGTMVQARAELADGLISAHRWQPSSISWGSTRTCTASTSPACPAYRQAHFPERSVASPIRRLPARHRGQPQRTVQL